MGGHSTSTANRRDFLLASLPSSGTSWLFNILKQHTGYHFSFEFFHPLANPEHREELLRVFGPDDLASRNDYTNVVTPWEQQLPEILEVYERTWKQTPFTATKDNHLSFKLGFFVQHFDVVVLYRHRRDTFPPSVARADAWNWYAGLYDGLVQQRRLLDDEIALALASCEGRITKIEQKAIVAHTLSFYKLLKGADEHGLPVLNYASIVDVSSVAELTSYLREKLAGYDWPVAQIAESMVDQAVQRTNLRKARYIDLGLEELCQELLSKLGADNLSGSLELLA